jgi:serine/threonine protein kinase
VLEILGEGSFGTVCVARDRNDPLRRKVALKILKVAYSKNKKITDRTRDEAKILSVLSHPNIVKYRELREYAGRPVVVMEHVEGVSLDQLLLRLKDGLPASIALEVMRQTCLALHAAYAEVQGDLARPLKVIHRDIKPSNVMLSIFGQVKVLDFGIARFEFEGREAQTESVVMGSRPYMAPERLDGVADTPAVDVYSAGMTLFELLTGRPMGLSINPAAHEQAMGRHLGYVQVQGLNAAAHEDLRDLIRRMCAYQREFRPSSQECARDMEQLLYALDRRFLIQLDDFAKSTVLPLYESRARVMPESGTGPDGGELGALASEGLLMEVTGAVSDSGAPQAPPRRRPYVFVGSLVVVVALLAAAASIKALTTDARVRVELWIPSGAVAVLGDVVLRERGVARVEAGAQELELTLENGRRLRCAFDARGGTEVRWVGNDAISVDDGEAVRCTVVDDAR